MGAASPMGALVADVPDEARAAVERQFVDRCEQSVVDGRLVEQPMALATSVRS